jgi:ATP-dependent Clp protease ATP-binding subunit ClpX
MDGAELEFREDGLAAIARRAMERKTGARGLRTIMETILLETMYQLPSLKNVSKVVVDESVVLGHAPPYVVYKSDTDKAPEEPRRASGFGR